MTLTAAEVAEAKAERREPPAPKVDHDAESEIHAAAVQQLADIRDRRQAGITETEATIAQCRAALAAPEIVKLQEQLAEANRKLAELRDNSAEERAANRVRHAWPSQLREAMGTNEKSIETARNRVDVAEVERLLARRAAFVDIGNKAMSAAEMGRAIDKIQKSK